MEAISVKKVLIWFSVFIIVIITLLASYVIYSIYFGAPRLRTEFNNRVDDYLAKTSYVSNSGYKLETDYSFKEAQFSTLVTLDNQFRFAVFEDNEGQLYDTYSLESIRNKVTNEGKAIVIQIFGSSARLDFDIPYKLSQDIGNSTEYSELEDNVKSRSSFIIRTNIDFLEREEFLKKCFSLVQWIQTKHYEAEVNIYFTNDHSINIPFDYLNGLTEPKSIQEYIK